MTDVNEATFAALRAGGSPLILSFRIASCRNVRVCHAPQMNTAYQDSLREVSLDAAVDGEVRRE
jgi:hypothetical protein